MKYSPNSKALRDYKSQWRASSARALLVSLTAEQREAAVGLLLGDVSIQSQNQGKTYRLKFEWGDVHKDYAFHIFTLFKQWILTHFAPKERIRSNMHLAGNRVSTWWFQTFSHEAFIPPPFGGGEFPPLRGGIKVVAKGLILDHLTPRGLDYSPNKGKGISFNTQGFTEAEVQRTSLCVELREKFTDLRSVGRTSLE